MSHLQHYKQAIGLIASAIAHRSGFAFTHETIYSHVDATADCYHPLAKLHLEDARLALDILDRFLTEYGLCFDDLRVGQNNSLLFRDLYPTDDRGFVPECAGYTLADPEPEYPTLSTIRGWAAQLAKHLTSKEPDLHYALSCYKSTEQLRDFYEHLLTRDGTDIKSLPDGVLRQLRQGTTAQLLNNIIDILMNDERADHLHNVLLSLPPVHTPGQIAFAKTAEKIDKLKTAITTAFDEVPSLIELFFDSKDVCLGGQAFRWCRADYQGMYAYSIPARLVKSFDPVGKSIKELAKISNLLDVDVTFFDKSPKYTSHRKLTKGERESMEYFRGREIEFERFVTIKRELETINIRVGMLISSQSDIKGWNVTGGEIGQPRKDKAALFWTPSNGWEIDCRQGQESLTGVFEDWILIEHLAENNIKANNVLASDWHDERDEKAEAEAIELQRQEKQATTRKTQSNSGAEWIDVPTKRRLS
ncbi:MAG: hypothetical protein DI617_08945 [Streptococcus pyogenes]|nr:MAG: hypothetical protein DI617_08945 [Streptococcus pyogenes]